MKNCPRCAEQVQDAAKVCRYCGHQFRDPMRNAYVALAGLFAVIVLMFCLSRCQPSTDSRPAPVTTFSADRIAGCETLLKQAREQGLIRGTGDGRIDVEDRLWRALPASAKNGIVYAVQCAQRRRAFEGFEGVSVYGYRSGRRLALGTSAGVNHER